jgi:hypothetical protein
MLVLLSYNRGENWVRDTVRQLRGTKNYERNFWTLLANRETLDEAFRNETARLRAEFLRSRYHWRKSGNLWIANATSVNFG